VGTHALEGFEFRGRRMVGDDDGTWNLIALSHPRNALGHVPCTGGPYAFSESRLIGDRHRIGSPSKFESTDGLQVLELEVDLDRTSVDIQPNEGRPNDEAVESIARSLDFS
jgi:hypothetical protein